MKSIPQAHRRLRKLLVRWLENPRNSTQRPATARDYLQAALAARDPNVFRGKSAEATSELSVLERRFGAQGILEGYPESWRRLHASPRLQAFELSVLTSFLAEVAALALSHLYCIGETALASGLGRVMFDEFTEHYQTKRKSTYTYDGFASLALYFWALENRDTVASALIRQTIKHKAFRPLLEEWNSPKFEAALVQACDYHVTHAYKDDDDFAWSPYDLLPIEIIWIGRLRSAQDLPMPSPSHVLLDSSLYTDFGRHTQDPPPPEIQDALDKLKAKARELNYPLRFPLDSP